MNMALKDAAASAAVLYDIVAPGIARITLNDPAHRNAYTVGMCAHILAAIQDYARRDELKVLILTGKGDAFCAGGNLRHLEDFEPLHSRTLGHSSIMRESMHAVNMALYRLDKPVIARIVGPAVSGGMAMALLCDFRIASQNARLGDPSGRAGLMPDEGGAWLWPRTMGLDAAMKMVMLGEIYDAATALRLGLITEVVAQDALDRRVMELAGQLASKAPIVMRTVKKLMRRSLLMTFEQSLGDVDLVLDTVSNSQDAKEGVEAFRAKRPPVFTGH